MSKSGTHRPEPPAAAPPVAMTEAFLDFLRATLVWKLDGLSEADARRPMTPSGVSLLGIVRHSAFVERWWFAVVFAGEPLPTPWSDGDPDADWRIGDEDTIASVTAFYEAEIARSRAIVAGAGWDDRARRRGKPQTLGWILTHMVEEVARHCGHADIIREAIDGRTGE